METQEDFNFGDGKKICSKCSEVKDLSEFCKGTGSVRKNLCKSCKNQYQKEWRKNQTPEQLERTKKMGREWVIKNRGKVNRSHVRYNTTIRGRFRGYKIRAKKRGFDFEFDFELFKTFATTNCHHCGGEGYGIDRLNSSQGYTISNSVPCCSECNYSKRHHDEEVWVKHLVKIVEHKGLL